MREFEEEKMRRKQKNPKKGKTGWQKEKKKDWKEMIVQCRVPQPWHS